MEISIWSRIDGSINFQTQINLPGGTVVGNSHSKWVKSHPFLEEPVVSLYGQSYLYRIRPALHMGWAGPLPWYYSYIHSKHSLYPCWKTNPHLCPGRLLVPHSYLTSWSFTKLRISWSMWDIPSEGPLGHEWGLVGDVQGTLWYCNGRIERGSHCIS